MARRRQSLAWPCTLAAAAAFVALVRVPRTYVQQQELPSSLAVAVAVLLLADKCDPRPPPPPPKKTLNLGKKENDRRSGPIWIGPKNCFGK